MAHHPPAAAFLLEIFLRLTLSSPSLDPDPKLLSLDSVGIGMGRRRRWGGGARLQRHGGGGGSAVARGGGAWP